MAPFLVDYTIYRLLRKIRTVYVGSIDVLFGKIRTVYVGTTDVLFGKISTM